jgi:hypothetical protein
LVEGLHAEGRRVTTVLTNHDPAAGVRTTLSEVWVSPELGLTLLTRVVDADNGQRTTALRNIRRTEPAPELFELPAGYTLRTESEPFTIEWILQ